MAWRWIVEARPLVVAPLWHVECWLTRDGVTDLRVTDGPDGAELTPPQTWAGADVRVRARYKQSEGQILEAVQTRVKVQFAEARRFEFEPICVPDRGLRAPQVALARTLGEKLAAWAEVAGVVLPEQAAAVADRLDGPAAEGAVLEAERTLTELGTLMPQEQASAF